MAAARPHNMLPNITFDAARNERNVRERGLSFERVAEFDFSTAQLERDLRRDYGEVRIVALGYLAFACMRYVMLRPSAGSGLSASARQIHAKEGDMKERRPLTDEDGEVRELLLEDIKRFRPITEVLSEASLRNLGLGPDGQRLDRPKARITLEISRDVLDRFRATGKGWQGRVDGALREWLESHPAK
jgi:uncharacterized protein (DUF4415 family)